MKAPWLVRVVVVALLLLCSSFVGVARAETRKVLLVVSRPTAFSARLSAEIEMMHFEIVPVQSLDAPDLPRAIAAVRVLETSLQRRVELWVANPADGKLELGTVVQPSPDDDEASQTVRASEQLRAFLEPLSESETTEPPPEPAPSPPATLLSAPLVPPTPPVQPVPARARRHFAEAASLTLSLDSNRPAFGGVLQARWFATSTIGVGAIIALPMFFAGETVRSGPNSAHVNPFIFGSELTVTAIESRAWPLTAVADVAVVWLKSYGAPAKDPYKSQSDNAVVALPMLGVELAPRIDENLRLCLGARVGFALPRPDIAFAGVNVATFGRPFALFSIGVSYEN